MGSECAAVRKKIILGCYNKNIGLQSFRFLQWSLIEQEIADSNSETVGTVQGMAARHLLYQTAFNYNIFNNLRSIAWLVASGFCFNFDDISPGRLHENYAAIVTRKAFRNDLKKVQFYVKITICNKFYIQVFSHQAGKKATLKPVTLQLIAVPFPKD